MAAFVGIYVQKLFCESPLSYARAPGFGHIRPSLVIRSKTGGLAAAKQLGPQIPALLTCDSAWDESQLA